MGGGGGGREGYRIAESSESEFYYLIIYVLNFQRHWIVLDAKGNFITQRKDPKLALVVPHFEDGRYLCLNAPGMEMLKLEIQLPVDQREFKRIK